MYSSSTVIPKGAKELRHTSSGTTETWIFCKKVALGGKSPVAVWPHPPMMVTPLGVAPAVGRIEGWIHALYPKGDCVRS